MEQELDFGIDRGLFAPLLQIQSGDAGSQQNHGCRFRDAGCWLGGETKRDAVVPEVAVGIESKRDVVAVLEISLQRLQLRGGKRVDEGRGRGVETLLCQKRVSGAGGHERVAAEECAGEVVGNVSDWCTHRISKRSNACASCRVEQVNKKHVWICIPVADVGECQRSAGDCLTSQVHVVNTPRVGTVVVQVELLGATAALVGAGNRGLKRE